MAALGDSSDFYAYARMVDMPTLPCAIIEPADTDYTEVFQAGQDCWYFLVYVMVARQDVEAAQLELDEYIAGWGEKSLRRIIYDNYTLGLEDTQAFVTGMKGYGGSFEANKTPMVGAVLTLKVLTDGRKT